MNLIVVLLLASVVQASTGGSGKNLAALQWIAGEWTASQGGAHIEERWMAAAGGMMLGMSRTVRGARAAFENLRIVERQGAVVYVAQPGGRPPTEFTMLAMDGESVTFQNRAHDYPKVIVYRRTGADTIEARVGDGAGREEAFVLTRRR